MLPTSAQPLDLLDLLCPEILIQLLHSLPLRVFLLKIHFVQKFIGIPSQFCGYIVQDIATINHVRNFVDVINHTSSILIS